MNEEFLKLTNIAYKVIEFFPESDPLKNRAKNKTLSIMENMTLLAGVDGWASFQDEKIKLQIAEDIDILLGYFWIAKTQGWLNASNYLIISNEYEKVKKSFGPYIEFTQKIPFGQTNNELQKTEKIEEKVKSIQSEKEVIQEPLLKDRHKKIIEYLENNEKGQVMDLQKVLPNITKRTIRRDLDDLLRANKVVRVGEFNQVFYRINRWDGLGQKMA